MRYVSQPVKKLDGMPIIKGKPLYTNDLAPNECLIVLALRSPYAYARIKSIDTSKAMLVKGVECVQGCPTCEIYQCRTDLSGMLGL